MVKADQLYQLDLRLREIKFQPDKIFGGVALFFFGDIMQLQPVQGKYIWCKPNNEQYLNSYLVNPHWEHFSIISLVQNHRQQKDMEYANMLNRIRVGEQTDEDISRLHERVVPDNHQDIKDALIIACKHTSVNKYNSESLERLTTPLIEIEAINSHTNLPNYRPRLHDKKRTVHETAYLQTLKLKIGCRVMVIDNVDVLDKLCNGSIGTLQAVTRDKRGNIENMMIEFDDPDTGRKLRSEHPLLAKRYPRYTPIKKRLYKYSTSTSKTGSKANAASVYQFPLILCFASTCHKIQGATVVAPRKAALDMSSVFGPSQAYVMLGRTQSLDQISIIGSFDETKALKTNLIALTELERMKAKSLNENPPVWEQEHNKSSKVFFHNICSLRLKMDDLREDPIQTFADVIILAETWLPAETNTEDNSLHIEGTTLHLNNCGRGKGLAIYTRGNKFIVTEPDVNSEHLQMTIVRSNDLTILGLYRSKQDKTLATQLTNILMTEHGNSILVIGDFNITSAKHEVFDVLIAENFSLLDNRATHFEGGCAYSLFPY
jgi:hypothetical protein